MKREIKFRAWDGKEMRTPTESQEFANITFHAWMDTPKTVQQMKKIFIMQYTGLKDKNGKEIYEGDIVELVGGTCAFLSCGIYDDQKYKIGDKMIIQCLSSGFTLCGFNMYDCTLPNRVGKVDNYTLWNHARSLKIIGNIYENQNLLT
mgnify:CR=1 FL=1